MLIYRGSFSVFSTYVEVIPKYLAKFELVSCILHVCGGHPIGKRPARPTNKYSPSHVCGGHPIALLGMYFCKVYSPRMWRSSQFRYHFLTIKIVFSTSVEVILTAESGMHCGASILHACGGDPLRD